MNIIVDSFKRVARQKKHVEDFNNMVTVFLLFCER